MKITLQIVNKACHHKICNSAPKRKGYAIGQREQTTVTLFNEFREVKAKHQCRSRSSRVGFNVPPNTL